MAIEASLSPPPNERFAKALQFIEEMTKNCDKVQEKVLAEILAQNANTEYLERFNLGGATDRDSFKSRVPVVTYEDLQPEIQRIANGDRSPILCSRPISEFLTSSGTSAGERKLMPTISEEMDRRQLLYSLLMPVMNFPDEAILCVDSFQSMYTQMLCGLLMREEVLESAPVFASGLLRAIRFLQINWRQLAHDISTGSLNPRITDPAIQARVAKILKPNPNLAEFITKECEGENWERIIPRIWPNTKYLDVIVTGAMAQYIPLLDFYSGGLPKPCTMYASSECYFGLNLKPMTKPDEVSYTIMPNMGYFEFIPHDPANPVQLNRDSPPRLVDLADLETGKEYELVVTTYSGLCRYRVGDILRVTGFHNSAPQFKFIRRKNVLLSIDADKTDESELQKAVENAYELLREFDTTVVEYTSYADTNTIPGHYVIYWELLVKDPFNAPSDDVLEKCCLVMEESMNSVYRQCRVADNSVGPLEIRVVRNGTFEEVMDYAISRGASINQYKAPRCVSYTPIVELLDARVLSAHFSPTAPHWTPERRV
ncbi:hypothetical protein DH2020_037663 [Rehmannia glutinosa]|uniref:Indole-3-acetic acid-amido synthetase n=1 Tax=Rehmannia glutinosa TaxID=99300 RepID=A0ABR0V0Q1_REHGL